MHTTTTSALSDAINELQKVMTSYEAVLAFEPDDEEQAEAVEAIMPLALTAVLVACHDIMTNTSPAMWSVEERDYIESCMEHALETMEMN